MIGRVVSIKMQQTATVLVEGRKTHPLYKKSYVSSKKYLADDPVGTKLGDIVEIVKIKPISKRKHWQVKKVLGTDIVALGEEHLKEKAQEAIEEIMPEEVSENSENSESQKVSKLDEQSSLSDKSDKTEILSHSEPSEDKKIKRPRKVKK